MNEVHDFYQKLYTSQNITEKAIQVYLKDFNPPKIQQETINETNFFISEEEIKIAISDLNKNKSPGDDGITAEFYKKFHLELTPIFAEVYNNIFNKEKLTKSMKRGIVTLIFKNKGSPNNLKFWQPISLLNIDYKILTKILTKKIYKYVNDLVNPFQRTGSKERNINNNLLNVKMIIEYIKQNNINTAFLAMDNEKAFDRIEHNFIKAVLKKYNFSKNFIKWFNIIYSDITSKIMVNGTFTKDIKINRSVRQGCPLSMILYILFIEPLIYKISQNTLIKGIKIPNCEREIKTIQHADDIMYM